MYTFTPFTKALASAADHLKQELATIRTGRAAPALLDGVRVEAYGSSMKLEQVASVTIEDARSIRVAPWDQSQVRAIERALSEADLGVSLATDERGVRVSFPELTSERREQLVKITRTKLEEARAMIRREREAVWQDIQKQEKEKQLSEDEKFRAKEQMEKLVQDANRTLEELAERKEAELKA